MQNRDFSKFGDRWSIAATCIVAAAPVRGDNGDGGGDDDGVGVLRPFQGYKLIAHNSELFDQPF